MKWWGSKPQSVTVKSLDSDAYILHLYSSPSSPHFLLPFSGLLIPFIYPSGPIPYRPPYFTRQRRFSISLHPLLPPTSLVRSWSDCPPGRRSCPPSATACLRFPPLTGVPKEFLAQAVPDFTRLVFSSCRLRPVPRYLLAPVLSRPGVPPSLCLPPPTSRLILLPLPA